MDTPQQRPAEGKERGAEQAASRGQCAARYTEDYVRPAAPLCVVCRLVLFKEKVLLCQPRDLLGPFPFFCLSVLPFPAAAQCRYPRGLDGGNSRGYLAAADLRLPGGRAAGDVWAVGGDVAAKGDGHFVVVCDNAFDSECHADGICANAALKEGRLWWGGGRGGERGDYYYRVLRTSFI